MTEKEYWAEYSRLQTLRDKAHREYLYAEIAFDNFCHAHSTKWLLDSKGKISTETTGVEQ